MDTLPLHPAMVHVPLGLAVLMPLLAGAFAWVLWTGRAPTRAWAGLVALQALLLGAGLVAMNTGEREEERVESIVGESALHDHEARAEQFVWAAGATLGLAVLVLALRARRLARTVAIATVACTIVVAAMAVRAGQAGGRLVYEHGAASAYGSGGTRSGSDPGTSARAVPDDDDREHGADDDREERGTGR